MEALRKTEKSASLIVCLKVRNELKLTLSLGRAFQTFITLFVKKEFLAPSPRGLYSLKSCLLVTTEGLILKK